MSVTFSVFFAMSVPRSTVFHVPLVSSVIASLLRTKKGLLAYAAAGFPGLNRMLICPRGLGARHTDHRRPRGTPTNYEMRKDNGWGWN
jgi:hypothetical protein